MGACCSPAFSNIQRFETQIENAEKHKLLEIPAKLISDNNKTGWYLLNRQDQNKNYQDSKLESLYTLIDVKFIQWEKYSCCGFSCLMDITNQNIAKENVWLYVDTFNSAKQVTLKLKDTTNKWHLLRKQESNSTENDIFLIYELSSVVWVRPACCCGCGYQKHLTNSSVDLKVANQFFE